MAVLAYGKLFACSNPTYINGGNKRGVLMHCYQDLSIKQEADSMTLHRIIIMRSIDGEGEKEPLEGCFLFHHKTFPSI